MKKKLILGMTVLFMIIAVFFIACPEGSSPSDDSSDDQGPVNDDLVIDSNLQNDPDNPGGIGFDNEDIVLTVNVKDESEVEGYQWYKNDTNAVVTTDDKRIAGATGKSYEPPNTIGTFYYYVVVTFVDGTTKTSQAFRVTVRQADGVYASSPLFETHPQSASYVQNTIARPLTVVVNAPIVNGSDGVRYPPHLSYQWYESTDSNANTADTGTAIFGADSATYLPSTAVINKKYYYVKVTNEITDNGDGVKNPDGTSGKIRWKNSNAAEIKIEQGAQEPKITVHPVSATYQLNQTAASLFVTVTPPTDGGTLTYQWFRNRENSNIGGTPIDGAAEISYRPPTDEDKSVIYYYCEVTNTVTKNNLTAKSTAKSLPAYIGINVVVLRLGGVKITPKDYDGTEDAEWEGDPEPSLTPKPNASIDIHLNPGSVKFADPNAGTGKAVIFIGWSLIGDTEILSNYVLEIPRNVTGTIRKAEGASVPVPVLDDTITYNPTSNKITVKVVIPLDDSTDQSVEYNISKNNDGSGLLPAWQTSNVFTNLTVGTPTNTPYYIYARSRESDNYKAGNPPSVSAGIKTSPGATVTKPAVSGTPTDSSITVGEVTPVETTNQSVEYAIKKTSSGSLLSEWQAGATFNSLEGGTNYLVYARSKANSDYNTGADSISDPISTAHPKVTFYVNGATSTISPKTITRGQKLPKNDLFDLLKPLHTFDYWYTDSALTEPYDFNKNVNSSFDLYANWILASEVTAMEDKDMVWIPGGWFKMGSPTGNMPAPNNSTQFPVNENPQHAVGVKGFWMGIHQVTQAEWEDVMKFNYSSIKTPSTSTTPAAGSEVQAKRPVETISWYAALVYCNERSEKEGLRAMYMIDGSISTYDWGQGQIPTNSSADVALRAKWDAVTINTTINLNKAPGYRLPTEAEWEYACRGTNDWVDNTTLWNCGNTWVNSAGWSSADAASKTHQVGLKDANGFGLYDMHGNVWEWCWDWYDANYYATFTASTNPTSPVNPMGPSSGTSRVVRGGVWVFAATNLRSAYRGISGPYSSGSDMGLRIVRP